LHHGSLLFFESSAQRAGVRVWLPGSPRVSQACFPKEIQYDAPAKSHMITTTTAQTALLLSLLVAGSSAFGDEVDLSKLPPPAKKNGLSYAKDIRPMFEASCFRCHTGDRPKAGLRLDTLDAALKGSKEEKVIIPGKSEQSILVIAVAQIDPEKSMPPKPRPGRRGPGGPPGGGPGGPGGFGAGPGGPPPGDHGDAPRPNGAPPSGPGGGPRGGFGPPPKPLTPEQVGLVRAWIDQGAK
jgi:hypothetical protein